MSALPIWGRSAIDVCLGITNVEINSKVGEMVDRLRCERERMIGSWWQGQKWVEKWWGGEERERTFIWWRERTFIWPQPKVETWKRRPVDRVTNYPALPGTGRFLGGESFNAETQRVLGKLGWAGHPNSGWDPGGRSGGGSAVNFVSRCPLISS